MTPWGTREPDIEREREIVEAIRYECRELGTVRGETIDKAWC